MLKNVCRVIRAFLTAPCRFSLAWVPFVVCAAGFVLHVVLFYPGILGADEHSQYHQIEEGILGDWHPPVMAATWILCRNAGRLLTGEPITGYGILYVLWTFVLWSGVFLILRSAKDFWRNAGNSQKSWGIVFIVLPLLLWSLLDLFGEPRNVGKDTGMLAAYMFAIGCLFNVSGKKPYRWAFFCAALLFLFYGTAIRHNTILAAFPLLCWAVWTALPFKRLAVVFPCAFVIWIVMLVGIDRMNYHWIGAVRLYPLQERFYGDIFHLDARTNRFVIPPNTFGNDFTRLDEATFREHFDYRSLFITAAFRPVNRHLGDGRKYFEESLVVVRRHEAGKDIANTVEEFPRIDGKGEIKLRFLDENDVREQFPKDIAVLRRAWINRVLANPLTYVVFKTEFFVKFCRKSTLYFLGLNPLLLLPVLFFFVVPYSFSKRLSDDSAFPGVMLGWSALLYILPLWVFLPDDNIRYLLWFFAASIISVTLLAVNSRTVRLLYEKHLELWDDAAPR